MGSITYFGVYTEQSIKQERWLHHHPKGICGSFVCTVYSYGVLACQQLLKKAELLGHTNDTVTAATGGRGKITPSLSCDFVNYYIGRYNRWVTVISVAVFLVTRAETNRYLVCCNGRRLHQMKQ